MINDGINCPRGKNDGINDGINRPRGENDGINEVINPEKDKNEVINEVINPQKDKTEVITEVIKSKLSHIAAKKRGRIEKLLEIINENPSVASDSIAVQLDTSTA